MKISNLFKDMVIRKIKFIQIEKTTNLGDNVPQIWGILIIYNFFYFKQYIHLKFVWKKKILQHQS